MLPRNCTSHSARPHGSCSEPFKSNPPGLPGTLFGLMLREGKAAPLNELVLHVRGAIFCNFVWRICQ